MHLLELFKQLQQKCQEIYIYFYMMCMHVCVWMCGGGHVRVQLPTEARVVCQSPGAGVTGACEVPNVRAGN